MPGGRGNIRPEDNTGGFHVNPQNINRKGQPPSIKRRLKELLKKEGILTIDKEQVISVNEDGSVSISITTETMLALTLEKWAVSGEGKDSLKAINMIMLQIDGAPHQTTDVVIDPGLDLSRLSIDERKQYLSLVRKAMPTEETEETDAR